MIKRIVITNYLGQTVEMILKDPETSGFVIEEVKGLGPPKADIHIGELATYDGGLYNSSRANVRNIVVNLLFYWTKKLSIEDIRLLSYRFFPLKKYVDFEIETDNRHAVARGYVESNEPDIFSKEEGTEISIQCPDPYFHSKQPEVIIFSGVGSMFEFEFSNESTTEGLLEFGNILTYSEQTIFYDGDADVGITIIMEFIGRVDSAITIYNTGTRESMIIDTSLVKKLTGSQFVYGDVVTISTVKSNKYISLLREGITYNILNALGRDTDWFSLTRGDNIFAFVTGEEVEMVNIQFKVEHDILYEGV